MNPGSAIRMEVECIQPIYTPTFCVSGLACPAEQLSRPVGTGQHRHSSRYDVSSH